MKLAFTKSATSDLKSIHEYIEMNAGTPKAKEILTELRDCCLGLAKMPDRFEVVEGYTSQSLRRRVHRNYLIVYRLHKDQVQIIRVFHGAQDYLRLLKQEFSENTKP